MVELLASKLDEKPAESLVETKDGHLVGDLVGTSAVVKVVRKVLSSVDERVLMKVGNWVDWKVAKLVATRNVWRDEMTVVLKDDLKAVLLVVTSALPKVDRTVELTVGLKVVLMAEKLAASLAVQSISRLEPMSVGPTVDKMAGASVDR